MDVLYKDRMRLDLQLEDNQDEQKRFVCCVVLSILKEMLYQLDLLLMGVTPSHPLLYIQLLEQMDETTRKLF